MTTRYTNGSSRSSSSSSAYAGRVLSSPYRVSGSASRGNPRGSATVRSSSRLSTRYTTSSNGRFDLRGSTDSGRLSRSGTSSRLATSRSTRASGTTTGASRLSSSRSPANREAGPRLASRFGGSASGRSRNSGEGNARLQPGGRRGGDLGSRQSGTRGSGGRNGIHYGNRHYSGYNYQRGGWCSPHWGYQGGYYYQPYYNCWTRPWYGSWCRPYYNNCYWWPNYYRCRPRSCWSSWSWWYCDSWLWNNLWWSYWPSGYSDVAVVADAAAAPIEDAVESDEERAAAELALGDYYFRDGRYDDAAQAYLRAIELAPEDGSVRFVMADALFALGTYHYAAYMIAKGLELDPSLAAAKIDKREFYGDPSDFSRHMEALDKYLVEKPYDAAAHLVKAYNLKFSDRAHGSVKSLERCLHIDPGNQAARALLDGFIEIGGKPDLEVK